MIQALLAPPLCWSCHAPAARGAPLCRGCRQRLRFLPRAPVCLGAVGAPAGGLAVWAPVAYEGPARELVKGLKFRGAMAVAETMAALIVSGMPEAMLAGPPALIPVPLHPGRRRSRAFNQAEAIAAAIAARTGLRVTDGLVRTGPNRPQVGRGRAARLTGPAGSIEATSGVSGEALPGAALPGAALLVDDVVTTGGTLVACAAALRKAGVRRVAAVTFARTVGR